MKTKVLLFAFSCVLWNLTLSQELKRTDKRHEIYPTESFAYEEVIMMEFDYHAEYDSMVANSWLADQWRAALNNEETQVRIMLQRYKLNVITLKKREELNNYNADEYRYILVGLPSGPGGMRQTFSYLFYDRQEEKLLASWQDHTNARFFSEMYKYNKWIKKQLRKLGKEKQDLMYDKELVKLIEKKDLKRTRRKKTAVYSMYSACLGVILAPVIHLGLTQ